VYLVQKETSFLSRVTIPGFGFLLILLPHGLYIPFLLTEDVVDFVPLTENLKVRLVIFLCVAYFSFWFGLLAANRISKFSSSEFNEFERKPIAASPNLYIPVGILAAITLGLLIWYIPTAMSDPYQFLYYFSGEANYGVITSARQNYGVENSGVDYLYGLTRHVISPLITTISIAIAYNGRKKIWWLMGGGCACVYILQNLYTLHKVHLIQTLVIAVLFVRMLRGNLRWSIAGSLALGLCAWLLMGIMYMRLYSEELGPSLGVSLDRVFEAPNVGLALYLEHYPDSEDFLYGWGIGLINRLSGHAFVPVDQMLFQISTGKAGTFDAMFASDLWVNFGYPGVVLGSFLLGLYLEFLQIKLVRWKKTPLTVGLMGFMLLSVWSLVDVGVFRALLTFGVLLGPIIALAIYWFSFSSRQSSNQPGSQLGGT
jgi:oligosaccharide repeat unit polymerase